MSNDALPFTGERYVPEEQGVIRLEHMHRYRLAELLCDGRDVLDVACGEGYGSDLMAARAKSVTGVDIAQDAVAHAQKTYQRDGLTFLKGSATQIPCEDSSFDLVVSFETLEHLDDHGAMMAEIKRVLRPEGLLLISSPNKAVYSDATDYDNPFHEHELYTEEFIALIAEHFSESRHLGQRTAAASLIVSSGTPGTFANLHEGPLPEARYDVVLASNGALPDLPDTVYEIVDSPLNPEAAEQKSREAEAEVSKLLDAVHHMEREIKRVESEFTRVSDDLKHNCVTLAAVSDENDRLRHMEVAMVELAGSANKILKSKWWKRSRKWRDASNALRSFRGRPKKTWPKKFKPQEYIDRARQEAARHPEIAAQAEAAAEAASRKQRFVTGMSERTAPHVTVVAMARNESARAHETMRHFCALFDRVVLVDHLSEDDTAAIVQSYDGVANTQVTVLRGEDAGYYQSEYMSGAANALIDEGKTDWIFFLDFDEFLPYPDAATLRQTLVDLAEEDVIHGHWVNVALTSFDQPTLHGAKGIIGEDVSRYVKVAINARRLTKDRIGGAIEICQGNHAVVLPGSVLHYAGRRSLGVLHVPITGPKALKRKAEQGRKALEASDGMDAALGVHWRDIDEQIENINQDGDLARELALNYGGPLDEILKAYAKGRKTKNPREIILDFAQSEKSPSVKDAAPCPTFTRDNVDVVMASHFPKAPGAPIIDMLAETIYTQLPDRAPAVSGTADDVEFAILAGATDVEVVVETAWLGHIPFLFSLMEILRPRRYVELGSHAGASFFAACQHMRSNGNYGEAVAIDIWTGDPQAGFYGEDVFERLKWLLSKHFPSTGRYIRAYFSDAAKSFEPASIDLLHIDGLHTYEAVKEDYDTWRPKLTENGVIIFHDTNEFQDGFGVWQLFQEVRGEATASFEFRHGSGLGVLAFGTRETNPAIALIEALSARPERFESYYSVLSKALFEAARFRLTQ